MRIDAHHHFWRIGRYDYVWMSPELGVLHRDYGPEDLKPLLVRNRIDRTVLVQTIGSLEETRWILDLSARHPFIAGVVGWVDLTDPAAGAAVDELCARGRLVGIRHQVHDEADPNWLLRSDVQHGLGRLAARGLPYDLLIRPAHLAASLVVSKRFPDLPLIVDHIAQPNIAKHGWDASAGGFAALSP